MFGERCKVIVCVMRGEPLRGVPFWDIGAVSDQISLTFLTSGIFWYFERLVGKVFSQKYQKWLELTVQRYS